MQQGGGGVSFWSPPPCLPLSELVRPHFHPLLYIPVCPCHGDMLKFDVFLQQGKALPVMFPHNLKGGGYRFPCACIVFPRMCRVLMGQMTPQLEQRLAISN